MEVSARNVLTGRIVRVARGATTGRVKLDIGGDAIVTASVTMEAIRELRLKKGDRALAIIKASDVFVGKE